MTLNGVMALILRYFSLFSGPHFALFRQIFVYDVVAKQLLGLHLFQNLLLIVYDHIKTICAIIQRLYGQKNDNSV